MLLKFSSRVVLYAANTPGEPDCQRIALYLRPQHAEGLLRAGQAEILSRSQKVIRAMRLTGQVIDVRKLGLKPGSFGIRREQTGSGQVYAHNSAWSQLVGRAGGAGVEWIAFPKPGRAESER